MHDPQPSANETPRAALPDPHFRLVSELPTTRKLARPVDTRAFVGTNSTDEPITSGLPVNQDLRSHRRREWLAARVLGRR
jgi:hypothetical protein